MILGDKVPVNLYMPFGAKTYIWFIPYSPLQIYLTTLQIDGPKIVLAVLDVQIVGPQYFSSLGLFVGGIAF
jgi:hypothetical protein